MDNIRKSKKGMRNYKGEGESIARSPYVPIILEAYIKFGNKIKSIRRYVYERTGWRPSKKGLVFFIKNYVEQLDESEKEKILNTGLSLIEAREKYKETAFTLIDSLLKVRDTLEREYFNLLERYKKEPKISTYSRLAKSGKDLIEVSIKIHQVIGTVEWNKKLKSVLEDVSLQIINLFREFFSELKGAVKEGLLEELSKSLTDKFNEVYAKHRYSPFQLYSLRKALEEIEYEKKT